MTEKDPQAPVELSTEDRAKQLGWKPPEEFKGDSEHALSAEEFVERGEAELPLSKENNRKLSKQVDALTRTISQMKDDTASFIDMSVNAKIKEYEKQKRKAVADGDTDAYDQADKAIEDVKKTAPKPTEGPHPAVQAFMDRNTWYGVDKKKTEYAEFLDKRVGGANVEEHFAEVEKRMAEQFPEEKETPTKVQGGGRKKTPSNGSKSFGNMEQANQDTCKRLVANGYVTEEAYIKNYYANREE